MPLPAFVQQAFNSTSVATSVTVTFSSTPTNGNVLIACVALTSTSETVASVSQTNVSWTFLSNGTTNADLEIWVGIVSASAGTAVSFTWPVTSAIAINIAEFSGLSGSTDGVAVFNSGTTPNNTSAFTSTTGAYTSSNAVDLIYVASACTRNVTASSLTAGYTALTNVSPGSLNTALSPGYQVVSSAGSQSCTFSYPSGFTGVKAWETVIVGFTTPTAAAGTILLAGKSYDPATAVSVSMASLTAMTAFDTTNLRLTFTAPANGKVLVRIRCTTTGAFNAGLLLGVLAGASVISRQWPLNSQGQQATTTSLGSVEALFTVTGLAGSNTWDAAYAVQAVSAAGNISYGGPNDALGSDAFGGFQFEIYTAQQLLASVLYDPAVSVSVSTTSLAAMTAFDTTNLRLSFTAPTSGNVFVRLRVPVLMASNVLQPVILLGILDGSTVRLRTAPSCVTKSLGAFSNACETRGVVTGLAGNTSYTWDAAYAIQQTFGTSIDYGGPNDASGGDAWGGFLYEIWSM